MNAIFNSDYYRRAPGNRAVGVRIVASMHAHQPKCRWYLDVHLHNCWFTHDLDEVNHVIFINARYGSRHIDLIKVALFTLHVMRRNLVVADAIRRRHGITEEMAQIVADALTRQFRRADLWNARWTEYDIIAGWLRSKWPALKIVDPRPSVLYAALYEALCRIAAYFGIDL